MLLVVVVDVVVVMVMARVVVLVMVVLVLVEISCLWATGCVLYSLPPLFTVVVLAYFSTLAACYRSPVGGV